MSYIKFIEILIPIIIGIAYITLGERKILGSMQRRKGPNIIGIYGILQPIVDGVKLLLKENIIPQKSKYIYYIIAPILTFILSILIWIVLPFNLNIILNDLNLSILFILAISSLSIYRILYGGWSSFSKYSIIGCLRATAQLISYEVSLGIIIMSLISINGNLNLLEILIFQLYIKNIFIFFPIFILFFISILAETNRTPFDLLEAESELVAGFLVEYSSLIFAAFYLGEYCFIFFMSSLTNLLFFGSFPSHFFTFFFIFLFIWVRATLPRLRFDQLLNLGWTIILPSSLSLLLFYLSIVFIFY